MSLLVPRAIAWRILCAVIALGLMVASIQLTQPASAMPTMVMDGSDCVEQLSCCEQGKKDCSQMPGCFAKCGGFTHSFALTPVVTFVVTDLDDSEGIALVLEPNATSPPRRPPRI